MSPAGVPQISHLSVYADPVQYPTLYRISSTDLSFAVVADLFVRLGIECVSTLVTSFQSARNWLVGFSQRLSTLGKTLAKTVQMDQRATTESVRTALIELVNEGRSRINIIAW